MQSFVKSYNKTHPCSQRESSADNSDITSALRLQIMTNAPTYRKELIYNSVLSFVSCCPFRFLLIFHLKFHRVHAVSFNTFFLYTYVKLNYTFIEKLFSCQYGVREG